MISMHNHNFLIDRPTVSSSNLFKNPYGPPFYPRQRPLIEAASNNSNTPKPKKKARRMQKMIKIKVPVESISTLENGHLSKRRSKSLSRYEQIVDHAKNDLNK